MFLNISQHCFNYYIPVPRITILAGITQNSRFQIALQCYVSNVSEIGLAGKHLLLKIKLVLNHCAKDKDAQLLNYQPRLPRLLYLQQLAVNAYEK